MKTTIFNKTYNVPITLDGEQFIKVGADLDMYSLQNAKVRACDTMSVSAIDIINPMYSDVPRAFLIKTDSTGDWSFVGGTAGDFADSTNMPYALYNHSTYAFAGFYNLDTGGAADHIAGIDGIANDSTYVARVLTDSPLSFISGVVDSVAMLKAAITKGIDKVLSATEVVDTTAHTLTLTFTIFENQYTFELTSFKYAVIASKYWKRLQFPFHTTFEGSWNNLGTDIELEFAEDGDTSFILIWLKDTYGNVSYPLIYVVNP